MVGLCFVVLVLIEGVPPPTSSLVGVWSVGQEVELAKCCDGGAQDAVGSEPPPLFSFRPRGSRAIVSCTASGACRFTPDTRGDYVLQSMLVQAIDWATE
jgi:hypothetical protein